MDRFDESTAAAAAYTPHATGELRTLRAVPDSHAETRIAFESRVPVPAELLEIAATCVGRYITSDTLQALPALIAAARIEYARAEYHLAALEQGFIGELTAESDQRATAHLAACQSRGWEDADVITANPLRGLDTPCVTFDDWIASVVPGTEQLSLMARPPCNRFNRPVSQSAILGAIVVSWIDTALCKPDRTLSLLAGAMQLFGYVRMLDGWDGAIEYSAENRSEAARNAAAASHARHRELRQQVIDAYRAGNYPSKDAAAFALARAGIPLSFRTIREALKGK